MKCTDLGNVASDETPESLPSHARALAAAPNGVHPGPADFGSEHSEPFEIARHGVIVQIALYDALEPRADHFDWRVSSSHQIFPDRFQRRPHPLRHGQPPHNEASVLPALPADVHEAEKIEGFRPALTASRSSLDRVASKRPAPRSMNLNL